MIIGEQNHPEVVGIKAYAEIDSQEDAIVINSVGHFNNIADKVNKYKKIGVVVQTTQKTDNFKKIIPLIAEYAKELKIYNTICATTANRQKEAREIAQSADLMIVVGSKTSANTTHLAELLREITQTIHIEKAQELDKYCNLIDKSQKIGVTAGASTPQSTIKNVIERIGE